MSNYYLVIILNYPPLQDQYISQLEEKHVACESQLYQTHKELERSKRDHLPHSLVGGQHNMAEYVQVQGQPGAFINTITCRNTRITCTFILHETYTPHTHTLHPHHTHTHTLIPPIHMPTQQVKRSVNYRRWLGTTALRLANYSHD